MKPWLLNILACPIDKHHPLEAYFFTWETAEDELEKIIKDAAKPSPYFKKQYEHLAKQIEDGTISLPAIKEIKDKSDSKYTNELHIDVRKFITKLESEDDKTRANLLDNYPAGMDVLYRYLNLIEVDQGLILCPECGRWYPIGSAVETIPELMPDDLREEERDVDFLRKWMSKLPEKVKSNGRPFSL